MRERFNTFTLERPRLRKIAGWTFVVIGFLGIIAPIIPGAPLLFIGCEILGIRLITSDTLKRFIPGRNKNFLVKKSAPVEAVERPL